MKPSISMRICGAMPFLAAASLMLLSCLGGCASITEGTTQQIAVVTSPPGAQCVGYREGQPVLMAVGGGAPANVDKSRHAIDLTCSSPGYDPAHLTVDSSVSTMGAIGVGIDFGLTDYATGALNKYPDSVTVTLKPKAR